MIKGVFSFDKWDFKSGSVLKDLPKTELDVLFVNTSESTYEKGQVLFRDGSQPLGIYFIKEGKVKKYKVDKDGREQIIYVANTGELVGYHALLAEERYPDSAATLEDSGIVFIPKENFLDALNLSEVLSRRLLKSLSHEFSVFANSLTLFAQRSAKERFAIQLILMREKYKQDFTPGMPVEINMSREDLASLVGTARENVVRMLKEFKEEGILETRGRRIIIKNINGLLGIANQ